MNPSHLSLRVHAEDKARWTTLAHRLGYDSVSELVRAVMTAMVDKYETEEWQSGLVHVEGNQIQGLKTGLIEPGTTYTFPVAAPARFWRYLAFLAKEEEKKSADVAPHSDNG